MKQNKSHSKISTSFSGVSASLDESSSLTRMAPPT